MCKKYSFSDSERLYFYTISVNEHIQNFVQIPITGAQCTHLPDSFSHGYAVPAPSKRELF